MVNRLKDKVALISGGASGMGAEEARLFAKEGATVVVADINEEGADRLVQEILANGGQATGLVLDVASAHDWESAMSTVERKLGRLDVLVNNGAINSLAGIEATELEDWSSIVAVNQTGTWLGMKHAVPLIRQGTRGGSIINLSSIYGIRGSGDSAAYAATKGAVRQLTKTAAVEYAPEGIRINSILPGMVYTPMTKDVLDSQGNQHPDILRTPLGRPAHPREIAYGALFLASDESSYITGIDLLIDGGRTAT